MPTEQPKLTYFPLLSVQPFQTRFDYVPNQTHPKDRGHLVVKLFIADREYGPYRTGIETSARVWQGRKQLLIPESVQRLNQTLIDFQYQLVVGWAAYDAKGKPITGEMVLFASGLKEIETREGLVYVR